MDDNKKHIDEDLDLTIPDKLSSDLKVLFKPVASVPPEIDRAIIERKHQHFIHRQKRLRLFRWSVSAAAAVLILMFMLFFTREHRPSSLPSGIIVVQADIDQSGSRNGILIVMVSQITKTLMRLHLLRSD
jgi:hypothetical protein